MTCTGQVTRLISSSTADAVVPAFSFIDAVVSAFAFIDAVVPAFSFIDAVEPAFTFYCLRPLNRLANFYFLL